MFVAQEPHATRRCFFLPWSGAATAAVGERSTSSQEVLDLSFYRLRIRNLWGVTGGLLFLGNESVEVQMSVQKMLGIPWRGLGCGTLGMAETWANRAAMIKRDVSRSVAESWPCGHRHVLVSKATIARTTVP